MLTELTYQRATAFFPEAAAPRDLNADHTEKSIKLQFLLFGNPNVYLDSKLKKIQAMVWYDV